MKRRNILYAVILIAAVGVWVWRFAQYDDEVRQIAFQAQRGTAPPSKPFEPFADLDIDANEGFSVEENDKDNKPLAGTASKSDWPQFNGRRRDNKSDDTGLLQSWPEGGPKLLWMARGLGEGYSTVAVVNGVIYTMGNKGDVEAVIALDAGTGEKIWSTPISWASQLSAGNGPRSTPTVHADAVYAMGGTGDLAALEASSGKIRWRKNILTEFGGGVPGWGICESVLIDENRLICTPGGKDATLVALNPTSGDVIWKSLTPDKEGAGYASTCISETGVRQYVQFTAKGTIGIRADDGQFLWREVSASNGTANCCSPLVSGDLVYSASNYGTGCALVKLTAADNSATAELVYKSREMTNHHGDMVIHEGMVFGTNSSGILLCLDLATGNQKWKSRSVGKGSITFADNRLYLRSEAGKLALIEPTAEKYTEHGQFEEPHRTTSPAWSHPVVTNGGLFLRDQDLLMCYDVRAK